MLHLLATGAAALGFALTPAQLAQFQTYYDLLVDWNTRINLTAITDPAGVQTRHFVDSLAVGAALITDGAGTLAGPYGAGEAHASVGADPRIGPGVPPIFAGGQGLIDLGTGAGFPGLPLKILWPNLPLTLVDSIGKKTAFLSAVVQALGLADVTVLTARAEALGQDKAQRARYDAATARAVAPLAVLAEYGLPLCRVGGALLASKKGDLAAELAQAERALPKLGGRDLALFRYTLPGETEGRVVVSMPKVAPTPPGYPRRVGLPKERPLGG